MSAIYDNWERLVDAVLKREELWALFHSQSRSPSISSDSSGFSSPLQIEEITPDDEDVRNSDSRDDHQTRDITAENRIAVIPKFHGSIKKVLLKLDIYDDKSKRKAMKKVSNLPGVESIAVDMKCHQKFTVIGDVDAVALTASLRKYYHTEIVSVGPANEPEPELWELFRSQSRSSSMSSASSDFSPRLRTQELAPDEYVGNSDSRDDHQTSDTTPVPSREDHVTGSPKFQGSKTKMEVKLALTDDKTKKKAMKLASRIRGAQTVLFDMEHKMLTATGVMDPVSLVSILRRKVCLAELVSVNH